MGNRSATLGTDHAAAELRDLDEIPDEFGIRLRQPELAPLPALDAVALGRDENPLPGVVQAPEKKPPVHRGRRRAQLRVVRVAFADHALDRGRAALSYPARL